MNTLLPALVVFALIATGCKHSGAPFLQGGEFSEAEKQALATVGLDHANWQPDYTAVWGDAKGQRRVFLFRNDIPSVVERIQAFAFDPAGRLVEANVVEVSRINGVRHPKAVLGVDPMRLAFDRSGSDGSEMAVVVYSASEGLRQLQEWCRRTREARARVAVESNRPK